MKKEQSLLFICLTLAVALLIICSQINIASAEEDTQALPDQQSPQSEGDVIEQQLGFNPENLPQTPEEAQNASSQYLKSEWIKILEKTPVIKQIIGLYKIISPYTDPIFKVVLGVEPSLSPVFFLALIIWVTILIYLYTTLSVFSTFSKGTAFAITIGLTIILSVFGVQRMVASGIVSLISKIISLYNTWWIKSIIWGVVLVLFFFASMLSKRYEIAIKKIKESMKMKKLGENVEELKEKGKIEEGFRKEVLSAFDTGENNRNEVLGDRSTKDEF